VLTAATTVSTVYSRTRSLVGFEVRNLCPKHLTEQLHTVLVPLLLTVVLVPKKNPSS
jgi:hypothetical protein